MLKQFGRQAGDTLIEVLFSITVFSAVAIGAAAIMTQGMAVAQNSLEINLVRNAIDSQAELLRYLQNAKLTTIGRGTAGTTSDDTDIMRLASIWDNIVGNGGSDSLIVDNAADFNDLQKFEQCKFDGSLAEQPLVAEASDLSSVFYLDTKDASIVKFSGLDANRFKDAEIYAQVRQPNEADAAMGAQSWTEMVWIQAVQSRDMDRLSETVAYDFHIRACWEASGPDLDMLKLGTIVRLYVPREDAR